MASTSSCPSHTLSSKLPLELSTIIWQLTLEPRIIELEFVEFRKGRRTGGFVQRPEQKCGGMNLPIAFGMNLPVAFSVCRESRDAVLHLYPLSFGSLFYPASTRFNFALDTLYLDGELYTKIDHLFGFPDIQRMQHLAVDSRLVIPFRENRSHSAWSRISSGNQASDQEWEEVTFARRVSAADNFFSQLQRAIDNMPVLEEVLIVYDLEFMGVGRSDSWDPSMPMRAFFDSPPVVIKEVTTVELPDPSTLTEGRGPWSIEEGELWKVPSRAVYGWRYDPTSPVFRFLGLVYTAPPNALLR